MIRRKNKMDNFEKYVREMVAKMEIVNDIVQETGKLNGEAAKLLMTRAIEPYGLWKAGSPNQLTTNGDATTDPGLMSIVSQYGMSIDGVKIKIVKKVDDFKGLCREMEDHGYEYAKGKGIFVPKWQGVQK